MMLALCSEYSQVNIPKEKLANGLEIPMLGLGTWKAEVISLLTGKYSLYEGSHPR
jgi:hypothetical protein